MQRVWEACEPRPEVRTGELKEESFAARLGQVVEGDADAMVAWPVAVRSFSRCYGTEQALRSAAPYFAPESDSVVTTDSGDNWSADGHASWLLPCPEQENVRFSSVQCQEHCRAFVG